MNSRSSFLSLKKLSLANSATIIAACLSLEKLRYLGIGTTNPKEHVQAGGHGFHNGGAVSHMFNIYYDNSIPGYRYMGYGGSNYGGALSFSPANGSFNFMRTSTAGSADTIAATAPVMVILQNGNVGVGASLPSQKLDAIGDQGWGTISSTVASDPSHYPAIIGQRSAGTLLAKTVPPSNDVLLSVVGKGWDGSIYTTAGGMQVVRDDNAAGANDMPAFLQFITRADNAISYSERMRITSDGNVGVGTSNPKARIHSYVDYGANPHPNGFAVESLRLQTQYSSGASGTFMSFSSVGDGTNYRGNNISSAYGYLSFGAPGGGARAETLVISGNYVGIGTTTPAAVLDVVGSLKSSNSWVKNTPENSSFIANGTLASFTMFCSGGPVLIFANLDMDNSTTNNWNTINFSIRVGSASGTTIRTVNGTTNNGAPVGNLNQTIQTLYNCPQGTTNFFLVGTGNAGITYRFYNLEFSAAELGLR